MKSYVYAKHIQQLSELLESYEFANCNYVNDDMVELIHDDLSLDSLVSNVLLDYSLNVRILSIQKEWKVSLEDVLFFLKQKTLGCYQGEDYLFYCLVFFKDYEITNQISTLLLHMDNELRHMLVVFVKEHGNVLKSSKLLYVHRNTMLYRLSKINEILGMNVYQPKMQYALAIVFELNSFK